MRYFNTLPNVITPDGSGNLITMTNLLIRTEIPTSLQNNPLLFYKYSVRDGETPELIANKYYGDQYRYWLVLYGNINILDPQWDWPLSYQNFQNYLIDKYQDDAGGASNVISYTTSTVHHYEKIVTTVDSDTGTTVIKTIEVDENTYISIQPFSTIQTFPDGSQVNYTVSTNAVSIYDYEYMTNESKRNINLINKSYVTTIEQQFTQLVQS